MADSTSFRLWEPPVIERHIKPCALVDANPLPANVRKGCHPQTRKFERIASGECTNYVLDSLLETSGNLHEPCSTPATVVIGFSTSLWNIQSVESNAPDVLFR